MSHHTVTCNIYTKDKMIHNKEKQLLEMVFKDKICNLGKGIFLR